MLYDKPRSLERSALRRNFVSELQEKNLKELKPLKDEREILIQRSLFLCSFSVFFLFSFRPTNNVKVEKKGAIKQVV